MPQGDIFSLLSTKTVRKLQTIFQILMKTTTIFIHVNKNCLQEIFCVHDFVAMSQFFCHGVQHRSDRREVLSSITRIKIKELICCYLFSFLWALSYELLLFLFYLNFVRMKMTLPEL